MILKHLKVKDFRNYTKLSLDLNDSINIIYGENGQGKTNLLESIYMLGLTKSHRNADDKSLIQYNKSFFKIDGTVETNNIPKKLQIILHEDSKRLKVDGNDVKKISDYISNLNVIIFYPEDLDIIKGSPSTRRKLINTEISGLQNVYYTVLSDYNKLLKMRNEYLKEARFDINYFDILTKYYVEKSFLLYKMRQKFIDRINVYIGEIYYDIMNLENFEVYYEISDILFDENYSIDKIYETYEKVKEKERIVKKTMFGPHRDDIEFYLDNRNMKSYASQGQQRAAILAFKLAEVELYKKYRNETPVLLLDDVFSELDHNKKENLLKYISNNIQTIITTTELDYVSDDIIKRAKLIKIVNGKIIKQEEVE